MLPAVIGAGLKILKCIKCAFISNCIAVLNGLGVLGEHCVLENLAGTVTLVPHEDARCWVNGSVVTSPCQLTQGKNSESLIHLHRVVMGNCKKNPDVSWL